MFPVGGGSGGGRRGQRFRAFAILPSLFLKTRIWGAHSYLLSDGVSWGRGEGRGSLDWAMTQSVGEGCQGRGYNTCSQARDGGKKNLGQTLGLIKLIPLGFYGDAGSASPLPPAHNLTSSPPEARGSQPQRMRWPVCTRQRGRDRREGSCFDSW